MADSKSEELIAELTALKQRAQELFAQHNRVQKELLEVLDKINRLSSKSSSDKPVIAPDSLQRR